MNIYVFGNKDIKKDNIPFRFLNKLSKNNTDLNFIVIKPNEDVPFENVDKVIILDTIYGINDLTVFDESDIEKLSLFKSVSVHDFDLGFQLKYLKKLGKLKKIIIVGLPQNKKLNYERIHSTLRKLVAQDMQGS